MDTNNHELWQPAKAGPFIRKIKFVKIRANLWPLNPAPTLSESELDAMVPR
jgi:hypothetical protein